MKEKMKIFTVESGKVTEGVKVDSFTLKGARVTIPTIIVGEEGRGRELGILPVQLLPDTYKKWQEEGYVYIHFATVGATMAGKPKLFQVEDADTTEKCICVFETMIGFRGGNSHTGDKKEEYWVPESFASFPESVPSKERYTWEEVERYGREYLKARHPGEDIDRYSPDIAFNRKVSYHSFPGEILSSGVIAQGDAGRMGSGDQYVAILPADTVFRTAYSGRLYGQPSEHYYIYREGQLLAVTREERELSDIF
ncbi:MAG TPA: hypothetical protein GX745_07420 [Clostridiales bacterium]|nr:hypothetical protein [Clostridiales bacterium]